MAESRYAVRVVKDALVFSAGHFITYNGDHCERIHGHNYRVEVSVSGELDENHYVFDFIALRDMTRVLVDELDHRMLLPTASPLIRLEDDGGNVQARYKDRRWSFPREECVLLPIANTTAELLADYLGGRLRRMMADRGLPAPRSMSVAVEECFGQWAVADWRAGGD